MKRFSVLDEQLVPDDYGIRLAEFRVGVKAGGMMPPGLNGGRPIPQIALGA